MHILITGGAGFIGSHLIRTLSAAGHKFTILSRSNRDSDNPAVRYRAWDGTKIPEPDAAPYDVIINLAGASIAGPRGTGSRKREILESREKSTRACVAYIKAAATPPRVFLSASAVGYYGADRTDLLTEKDPGGQDFPAQVCIAWEKAADGAPCRTVKMRIGIVLGKDGGAMQQMLPVYKTYLGGRFGSGKQGFPWIHIDDIVGAIRFCSENESLSGPVNLVAPETVDQAGFSARLARSLGKIDPFIVPEFLLKLVMGEQSVLFTGGQRASAQKLTGAGYTFKHPQLNAALADIV